MNNFPPHTSHDGITHNQDGSYSFQGKQIAGNSLGQARQSLTQQGTPQRSQLPPPSQATQPIGSAFGAPSQNPAPGYGQQPMNMYGHQPFNIGSAYGQPAPNPVMGYGAGQMPMSPMGNNVGDAMQSTNPAMQNVQQPAPNPNISQQVFNRLGGKVLS